LIGAVTDALLGFFPWCGDIFARIKRNKTLGQHILVPVALFESVGLPESDWV